MTDQRAGRPYEAPVIEDVHDGDSTLAACAMIAVPSQIANPNVRDGGAGR